MCVILVIDDDIGILEVVDEILSYENYRVIPLAICSNILEAVFKYQPELIIMDFLLQGDNGGALCRILKQTKSTCHIPVLLYSAYPDIYLSSDHFGADDFMAKPFDILELIAKVKNLLQ